MIEMLAFDADDTLWVNEPRYRVGEDLLVEALDGVAPADEVRRRLFDVEVANIDVYGYGVKAFVLSLVEVALELGGEAVERAALRSLVGHARWMMEGPVEVFDGVAETLGRLAGELPLMMITKGDLFEQTSRVERSGLTRFFRHVEIVGEKTPDTYRRLLERVGVPPSRFVMVGNSLRSDVLPVVEIGGHGIYLPYEMTWKHETVDPATVDADAYATVADIQEVPDAVRRIMGGRSGP